MGKEKVPQQIIPRLLLVKELCSSACFSPHCHLDQACPLASLKDPCTSSWIILQVFLLTLLSQCSISYKVDLKAWSL